VRFRDLPRSVQGPLLPAWILGLVGIIGSEANEGLLVALIPAGALLVVAGVALRDLSADAFRTNPRIVGLGAIVIGIGWGAIGVVELVTLVR
jgi:hypothetical protein